MDLPVSVAVLFKRTTEESQISWETFLIADGRQDRMLAGWVVRLSIHIQGDVGGLPVQCAPRSHLVFCIRKYPGREDGRSTQSP
jgi:hypothetical protein